MVLLALQGACFTVVGFVLVGILHLPRQLADIEAFSTQDVTPGAARTSVGPIVLALTGAFLVVVLAAREPAAAGGWRTLDGERRDAAATEAFLRRLMSQHRVAALSVAVLDGGRIVFERTLGVVDPRSGRGADAQSSSLGCSPASRLAGSC